MSYQKAQAQQELAAQAAGGCTALVMRNIVRAITLPPVAILHYDFGKSFVGVPALIGYLVFGSYLTALATGLNDGTEYITPLLFFAGIVLTIYHRVQAGKAEREGRRQLSGFYGLSHLADLTGIKYLPATTLLEPALLFIVGALIRLTGVDDVAALWLQVSAVLLFLTGAIGWKQIADEEREMADRITIQGIQAGAAPVRTAIAQEERGQQMRMQESSGYAPPPPDQERAAEVVQAPIITPPPGSASTPSSSAGLDPELERLRNMRHDNDD